MKRKNQQNEILKRKIVTKLKTFATFTIITDLKIETQKPIETD